MNGPIRLSPVVPCYNEEAVLEECARQLRLCLKDFIRIGKASERRTILFVNDGSRDRTWEIIEGLCRQDKLFSGLSLSRNFGHQSALRGRVACGPRRRGDQPRRRSAR